ncbi:C25 family cysteine peptidase [Pontibacter sp. MBLB2868]|uniref:putative type IX secretion system sortase PorU2 n=1 Tax=Pontibacter sp. MBLB2868 TaxID=3451555 RepID=UPI003F74CC42
MSYNLMLKRVILLMILSVTAFAARAQQQFGNEWINHSQTYYKIKVVQTGLHRLNYTYLNSLGLAEVNPQHFQLFRRGKEISLYVAGEADGKLDAQDFIEFYGERNDGALDRELYKDPENQVHQLYSLYTDTAAYFLTVNPAGGKRMREVNPAVNGRTPEPYHLQKAVYVNLDRYNFGKIYDIQSKQIAMPWMDAGEGWFSHYSINPRTYKISGIRDVNVAGPKPVVEYATVGAYQEYHNFDVNILPPAGTGRKLKTFSYDMFSSAKDKQQIEFTDITSQGDITLQISPTYTDTKGNAISFSYGILMYPQKPVFAGNSMFIYTDSTRSATPYYEFSSLPSSVVAFDITDQQNIIRVSGQQAGAGKGFVIEAGTRSHKLFLANTAQPITPVGKVDKVNFRRIDPAAFNYIILTNKRLAADQPSVGMSAPKAYAAYRASDAGGKYDTLLVYMDDIINQYHYGDYSANAIKRFTSFMLTAPEPKHMLILGKGAEYTKINYRNAASRLLEFVPTGGKPSSDVMLSSDFQHNVFVPGIPTGRVSATTATDIINYLNKVKQYEATPEGVEWRKNILQLGGGKTTREISDITSYLNDYAKIVEGPLLGANVIEKYRQNVSEVVENINVSEELNKGLSLITFFGHSSPGTTDLDIGYVSSPGSNYKNDGKYPVLLMNGCNVGDSFNPGAISFGEDWLNTANKGAVALIAHTDAGYPNFLNIYSSYFYSLAFQNPDFYGATIGKIQQETIKSVLETTTSNAAVAMVNEMVLHGDPALRLYSPSKPDYYFKDNTFEVKEPNGDLVTAASNSFTIAVKVGNLGKAITDPVSVTVKRTLPDNTIITDSPVKVEGIVKDKVILLTLNNKGLASLGMNTFEVQLDSPNTIVELNENNNTAVYQHYFPASGLKALSPAEYGIVNSDKVKLQAQPTQALLNTQGYYFELDTTQAFNSKLKQSRVIDNTWLPTWQVTLPKGAADNDSTVYYWRARFQHYAPGEDTVWTTSSFRYVPNTGTGWSQSHYGQFTKAITDKLSNEGTENLHWEFQKTKAEIALKTVGGDFRYTNPPYGIFYNGEMLFQAACGDPGGSATPRIFAIVLDDKTLKMVEKLGATYCASYPYLYEFGDLNSNANRDKMIAFMNAVPVGYHVIAMSVNKVPFESFTAAQKAAFTSIGSSFINNLKNGYPYTIVGRKGAALGTVTERTGDAGSATAVTSQTVILNEIVYSRQPEGSISSTIIGPALNWKSLHHNIERYKAGNDNYKLSVVGLDKAGNEQVLVEEVTSKKFDLSAISAKEYPNLKLVAKLNDLQDRTAPQLKEWFVLYEEAPEGVIKPDLDKVNSQTLSLQSEKGGIKVPMSFQNITPTAFSDSLTVEVTVRGDNSDPVVTRFKIKPLGGNETVNFEFAMPTHLMEGNYKLSMYVNPRILLEQNYSNNIFEVSFKVKPKLHPILDVAFDGIHILDGELVSPTPLISVTVKDENRFTPLQDPSAMLMVLKGPEIEDVEIPLMGNSSEVRYFPADEKNDFRLEYKPSAALANGKYQLEVSAKDAAGRASGVAPYRIGFEVENASKITNFYPFPNPFSTKTNFIFTLTGNEVPEHMKIQILTVTGKVVKEIMKEEMGTIRIGNNKTEYAWDGTDMYGDKLANGVYLYRVVMSQVSDSMKHMYKIGDKSFKNGYGKIYILR